MPKFLSRWIVKSRVVSRRLEAVVGWYLLSLMVESPKHTLQFASSLSGLAKSQFSRLLSGHPELAKQALETLSQQIGRAWSQARRVLVTGSNWNVMVIVDATLHPRSSLHVQNSQRFNHGEGFVIGHQWTNIVLLINERVIPLPPISFLSKNECRRRGLEYVSEHEKLRVYLKELQLGHWVGPHQANEVVVLMDAAYADKKLLRLIHGRGWAFVSALRSNRNVRTITAQEEASTARIKHRWQSVKDLFWSTRKQAPWETIRDTLANGQRGKRRKEFRARRLVGRLKEIPFDIALVCSEKSKGPGRIYLACSRTDIPIRIVVLAYRKRWAIELFHRAVKKNLGLQDAGVVEFDSMVSHVHWVYCAYLLLGEMEDVKGIGMEQRQRKLNNWLQAKSYRDILQKATQAGGAQKVKARCQSVLAELNAA